MEERTGSTMSLAEMRRLLGIGKTESFRLINQHYFKTILVKKRRRIDIASFEEWYANQTKHRKVDGPPPGEELRKTSYSAQDIADLLGIKPYVAYALIKRAQLPEIQVDDRMRIPREAFEEWYASQDRYRNAQKREKDRKLERRTLSMPEMAGILGVRRSTVYSILNSKRNREKFEFVNIAGKKRVTKESFENWYAGQHKYLKACDRKAGETQDKHQQKMPCVPQAD